MDANGGRQRRERLSSGTMGWLEACAEGAQTRRRAEAESGIGEDVDVVGAAVGADGGSENDGLLVHLLRVGLGGPRAAPGGLVERDGTGAAPGRAVSVTGASWRDVPVRRDLAGSLARRRAARVRSAHSDDEGRAREVDWFGRRRCELARLRGRGRPAVRRPRDAHRVWTFALRRLWGGD